MRSNINYREHAENARPCLPSGECVGQTPHRARQEFLVLRLKVQPVDLGQQTSGRVQLAINECGINKYTFCLSGRKGLQNQKLEVGCGGWI